MKLGVPWSVKKIRPAARETAQEAARRSGMSVDEWLNTVILQQAEKQGVDLHQQVRSEDYGAELAGMHHRLDDLTRRIDQLMRPGPAAYAPPHSRAAADQTAALSGRLDRQFDQFSNPTRQIAPPLAPAAPSPTPNVQLPPGLDRAVAEIAARRRALNGAPAAAPSRPQQPEPMVAPPAPMPAAPFAAPAPAAAAASAPAPMQAPMPTQNLTGLEDQLRRITDQIETLRKPGIEEAINALRSELGDIGRALSDAMPRRAIDSLERQIAELSQRVEEGRQAGIDHNALAGIEHGLAEVRDTLHGLTPAENLVGFNEAVANLAHKIDLIVAEKDPATLRQLESAITTLRDMASHVASDEAVSQLAAQVQTLADKVDHVAHAAQAGDAIAHLDQRISALAASLSERQQAGSAVPPQLEALVQSLSEKIEQLQASRGDNVAIAHLEDRIVGLVEKLDQSESRHGQLEAIERGLSDLLVHIEDMRANKQTSALRDDNQPAVDELKHDMARTQNALEAVHGTLGHLVDRLAMIEKGMRAAERASASPAPDEASAPPTGKVALGNAAPEPPGMPEARPPRVPEPAQARPELPRMPEAAPLQMPEPAQAAPEPVPPPPFRPGAATSLPLNQEPSADLPLEPGSGRPRFNARIAVSQAALGGAGPAAVSPAGSKSSFIDAARRAARAALQQGPNATLRPEPQPAPAEQGEGASQRGKVMKRVKSLFIAASIIALVVGSFQIAGNFFNFRDAPKDEAAKVGKADSGQTKAGKAETSASAARKPQDLAADRSTVPTLGAPAGTGPLGIIPPLGSSGATRGAPPLLNPPALSAPPAAAKSETKGDTKGDVTGSIPQRAAGTPGSRASREHLPATIGGTRLRNAALAGDAGAAYEVASRFADGRGVPADLREAARWFARAAQHGLALAQFRYASMLEKGQGVKKDLAEARQFYRAAADQGHAKAMHNLAVLYAEGVEGKPDYVSAVKWFRQAALRGIADSQYNLGVLTARGLGTEKSFADSYKWFALAAAQGDQESAKKRDEVASRLDAAALAAAQQGVKSFRVEPQPKKATTVPKPHGGWDAVADKPAPPKAKPHPTQPSQPSQAPLSLGSFTVGKR